MKKIFLNYINLYNIYKINKNYNFKNYSTNILIFNYINKSDVFICKLFLFKESIFLKINIKYYFFYLLIHSYLHIKKINHDDFYSNKFMIFLKKNIFNIIFNENISKNCL